MATLVVGTCRVNLAANLMKEANVHHLSHRVHSPGEVERILRHHAETPVAMRHIHTLSDFALKTVLTKPNFKEALERHRTRHASVCDHYDRFIIEVSTLRECTCEVDGRRIPLNYYVSSSALKKHAIRLESFYNSGALARIEDVQVERQSSEAFITRMARIRRFLGKKPILWLSHCNVPSPEDGEETLFATRRRLAETVRRGAEALGNSFFDPIDIVREMGRDRFFRDEGRDLSHLTPLATEKLAQALSSFAAPATHTKGPDRSLALSSRT